MVKVQNNIIYSILSSCWSVKQPISFHNNLLGLLARYQESSCCAPFFFSNHLEWNTISNQRNFINVIMKWSEKVFLYILFIRICHFGICYSYCELLVDWLASLIECIAIPSGFFEIRRYEHQTCSFHLKSSMYRDFRPSVTSKVLDPSILGWK